MAEVFCDYLQDLIRADYPLATFEKPDGGTTVLTPRLLNALDRHPDMHPGLRDFADFVADLNAQEAKSKPTFEWSEAARENHMAALDD